MKSFAVGLICCCLGSLAWAADTEPAQPPAKRVKRYALLIGINDYAPPLGKLEYCHNDMHDLRTHFAAAGFATDNVTFMEDQATDPALRPSKSNIDKQLELRLQLANADDVVVVAFSGHGLHIDGKSYLCPADARLDATESLISIDAIYDLMEKCRASQKVLIIDACRNEPIVRGFKAGKLADDLTIELQAPPKGVIVLSSCEPKQFSAEDAKLEHGVFMYYVIQGLKGAADSDTDTGGNGNGRVSLDELYFFAHDKTKTHVASSHRILQRPVMKGEMVGRFDLAMVPDSAKLKELASSAKPAAEKPAADKTAAPATRSVDHPLLTQADAFLRQADHENAIRAYTAIVDDSSLAGEVRREARKSRGAAYLARGRKADIDQALIDQLAAGLPGVRITVRAPVAELKVSNDVRGKVKQNQSLLVTKINGDWLWVDSVDGSDKLQGYVTKASVIEQPAPPPKPQVVQQPTNYAPQNYNNSSNPQYYKKNGRPPSVWETREWESLKEIREKRAAGLLR